MVNIAAAISQDIENLQYYYDRKWRVLVLKADNTTAIDVSNLRVVFNIQDNVTQSNQKGDVSIYNLTAAEEKAIIFEGKRVIIEAGYEGGPYGQIFDGNIIQPIRYTENAVDRVCKLICLDGDDFLNLGFCNTSIKRGMTVRDVVKQLVKSSTPPIEIGSIADDFGKFQISRGFSAFGNVGDYLRQIVKGENATAYVSDGILHITKLTEQPTNDRATELNYKTGLIGTPTQTYEGVNARALLNPRIGLNDWVKLNNQDIKEREIFVGDLQTILDLDGLYRTIQRAFIGDTRGNDWYVDLTTITQAGMIPYMLMDPQANGF